MHRKIVIEIISKYAKPQKRVIINKATNYGYLVKGECLNIITLRIKVKKKLFRASISLGTERTCKRPQKIRIKIKSSPHERVRTRSSNFTQ